MNIIQLFIDFVLHIDTHLVTIVNTFGSWTYLIVFAIIFIETGAVIMPFLPGDSLLFAACALSANPIYNLHTGIFVVLFWVAAVAGDSLNFFIGHTIGKSITNHPFFGRFIKEEKFFEKHGGISITLARFMPIIRTFAPFVAGASGYKYSQFIRYNLVGATAWVALCCGGGHFFGNFPLVKEHFSMIVLGIILVSLLPAVITFIKSRLGQKA